MRIVIIGAGAVGSDLARKISERDHDVVVVERDGDRLEEIREQLDCRLVEGNGISPAFLQSIGAARCDLFAAVTDSDQTNIIACLTAHKLGARVKVARVRGEEFYHHGRLALDGVDLAINPDHEAVHTAREILFQSAASEVLEFAGGRVRVAGARVDSQAPAAGKSLAALFQRRAAAAAVISVVREGLTLIPRGDTTLATGDLVYLAGERVAVDRSLALISAPAHKLERVMIIGANALGLELARDLLAAGIRVKLIDRSEERCLRAAEMLHHALVLHGEGSDAQLLKSEGIDGMDGFVALSSDEESNILACLLAHRHGARKTICLVDRPDYVPLLPLLGIDAAVSPRLSAASRIAAFVKRGAVISAETLRFTGAEVLQFRLDERCRCLDRPLARLDFPRAAVLGAVLKRGRVVTPRGETVLEAGDEVFVFALPEGVEAVEAFFAAH